MGRKLKRIKLEYDERVIISTPYGIAHLVVKREVGINISFPPKEDNLLMFSHIHFGNSINVKPEKRKK